MKLEAWKNILDKKAQLGSDEEEDDFDVEYESPHFEDAIIIQDVLEGYEARHNGRTIAGPVVEWDSLLREIHAWQEKEQYYPEIYHINERGNTDLLDFDGNIVKSWV